MTAKESVAPIGRGSALGVLLAVVCAVGAVRAEEKPIIKLTQEDKAFLLESARGAMQTMLADKEMAPKSRVKQQPPGEVWQTVYVTVFCDGAVLGSKHATEESVSKSVALAAARIGADLRSVPRAETMLKASRIKIDVIGPLTPVQIAGAQQIVSLLNVGVEGAAVKIGGGLAYILPTTILFNSMSAESMLRNVYSLGMRSSPSGKAMLMKFKTFSFIESEAGGKPLDLFRGNVLLSDSEVTPEAMEKSAREGGYWLLGVLGTGGKFKYRSNPVERTQDITYNMVRHAGVCWSLLWLYQQTGDEKFLFGVKKGFGYLNKYLKRAGGKPGYVYVEFAKKAPIGASALYMLCLADAMLAGADFGDMELLKQLGRFVLRMQDDSGRFWAYLHTAESGEPPRDNPAYYPGQAILALLHGYRLTPEKLWLDRAELAAKAEIARFRAGAQADHWTVIAMSELYATTRNQKYADICLEMADSILPHQILPGAVPDLDYIGGFDYNTPPRTASAATRMEALGAALDLARGLKRPYEKYAKALALGAKFIMQQQLRPENAYACDPTFTWAGGFHASPTDFELRIDYTQHCICALICAASAVR